MIAAKPTERRQMRKKPPAATRQARTGDRYRTLSNRIHVADARVIYARWRDAVAADAAHRSPTPMMRIAPDRRDATTPRAAVRTELAAHDAEAAALRTTMAPTAGDRLLDHLRFQPGGERALAAALDDDLDRRDGLLPPTPPHRPARPSSRHSRRRNRSMPPPTSPYSAPAPPPTRPAGRSPASTPQSVTRR